MTALTGVQRMEYSPHASSPVLSAPSSPDVIDVSVRVPAKDEVDGELYNLPFTD